MVFMLAIVPGRLREAMVEEAEPAAGDVRDDAVETLLAALLNVEALVKERPQAAARLRDAEAVDPLDDRFALGVDERVLLGAVLAQEGQQIADGGEPQTLDDRAFGFANQLVDVAGPEAAREPHADLR